eukprot:2957939-Pyramimonas_sp.AAC.1
MSRWSRRAAPWSHPPPGPPLLGRLCPHGERGRALGDRGGAPVAAGTARLLGADGPGRRAHPGDHRLDVRPG